MRTEKIKNYTYSYFFNRSDESIRGKIEELTKQIEFLVNSPYDATEKGSCARSLIDFRELLIEELDFRTKKSVKPRRSNEGISRSEDGKIIYISINVQ